LVYGRVATASGLCPSEVPAKFVAEEDFANIKAYAGHG